MSLQTVLARAVRGWGGSFVRGSLPAARPCARRHYSKFEDRLAPMPKMQVSAYDSMILRLTRSVKPGQQVPSEVSVELLDKANSRFRIMMMLVMMLFALGGSVVAIASGKRDRNAHRNSVYQQNKERYAKLQAKEEEGPAK